LIGGIKPKVVADEVAVKRADASNGNCPKRPRKNAIVGPAWGPRLRWEPAK
jgi:hypothetical protein